ncbi:MAG: VOC family protein [Gudongella sp.]|jgi:lactoylglutathione lyase|nr:VOC family protein [Gudongella sp.]
MKYCWTTLTVKDLEKSIEFYNGLIGLPIKRRFCAGPETEICFLGDGETQIELISSSDFTPQNEREGISMGFEVESIDKMMAILEEKGIGVHSGPFQPNPVVRFFYIKDPDGFKIQFVENL